MARPKKKATGPTATGSPLIRLANRRVPNAVKAITLCGNLAAYKPTVKQADQITTALRSAVDTADEKLHGKGTEFELAA